MDSFRGKQAEFSPECRALFLSLESARGQVSGNDSVTGDLRCEGVGAQCLADGAGRAATDAPTEGGISDDLSRGNFFQRGVDAPGEGGGGVSCFQWFSFRRVADDRASGLSRAFRFG